MKKIKPLIAYAVISKRKNKINVMDIFSLKEGREIKLTDKEKLIKVEVRVVE